MGQRKLNLMVDRSIEAQPNQPRNLGDLIPGSCLIPGVLSVEAVVGEP